FPKYLGKYARKMRAGRYETGSEGKFASRWRAKSPDALCAVLPYDKFPIFSCKSAGNYGIIIISTDSQRCQTGA
ncbi:hypothetical protein, partial [Ruminococcus sp.]